jgi:hypothetical protein
VQAILRDGVGLSRDAAHRVDPVQTMPRVAHAAESRIRHRERLRLYHLGEKEPCKSLFASATLSTPGAKYWLVIEA